MKAGGKQNYFCLKSNVIRMIDFRQTEILTPTPISLTVEDILLASQGHYPFFRSLTYFLPLDFSYKHGCK
jgi:hypothetical protein